MKIVARTQNPLSQVKMKKKKKKKKISHRPRWSVAWEFIPFVAL